MPDDSGRPDPGNATAPANDRDGDESASDGAGDENQDTPPTEVGRDATTSVLEIVLADEAVDDEPMTLDEAKAVTERIRQTLAVSMVSITKAYCGRAWAPLGYKLAFKPSPWACELGQGSVRWLSRRSRASGR